MERDDTKTASSESDALKALEEATKLYREQVDLAALARLGSRTDSETLSYRRTWKHPLGLVITK